MEWVKYAKIVIKRFVITQRGYVGLALSLVKETQCLGGMAMITIIIKGDIYTQHWGIKL